MRNVLPGWNYLFKHFQKVLSQHFQKVPSRLEEMMYAIAEIQGTQVKVAKDAEIDVPRLDKATGEKITLQNVLLIADRGKTLVGKPYIEGARVEASVVSHFKGKKIIVFKYKAKKNYRRKKGHRQQYSKLLILNIIKPDGEISKS